jgi:predicted O-linked N-acetylglucosamine transferase (SPINDLY family)
MQEKVIDLINKAIQKIQNGNLTDAEYYLKKVLLKDPNNFEALHFSGIIFGIKNQHESAEIILNKALAQKPNNHILHFNLAKSLTALGKYDNAISHLQTATNLVPSYAEAWLNYGLNLFYLHRYLDAVNCFDMALKLNNDYAFALTNKGVALNHLGRHEEAIQYFIKSINIEPGNPENHLNLGNAYKLMGKFEESLVNYDKALSLNPSYFQALSNKGTVFYELRRNIQAIHYFDRALEINPSYAEALSNKGMALNDQKHFMEALKHYDAALELAPNYAEAWNNKGFTLELLHNYHDALRCFYRAIELKPQLEFMSGFIIMCKLLMAYWENLDLEINQIISKIKASAKVITPFHLFPIVDDPQIQFENAKLWVKKFPLNSSLGKLSEYSNEKIKIGYISGDFSNHPVSMLAIELFESHDRDQFEIYAFSLRTPIQSDSFCNRLVNAFDYFINVEAKSDKEIAIQCRDLKIDIAVDLGGHTQNSRFGIFSFRAAPIQCSYLGYAGTTGANYIDYIIADSYVIPKEDKNFYSEKICYLPNSFMTDDSKRIPSFNTCVKSDFNLPEGQFIFCCFNNSYKFNLRLINRWSRILLNVNNSILWISDINPEFSKNILKEFGKLGIGFERIFFSKKTSSISEYLSKYRLADLFLDSSPYNAHSTGIDALKAGLPILTLTGSSFVSRVGTSLLSAIELPELIATSELEYERLAIELATNPDKLIYFREKLSIKLSTAPLFDGSLFRKNIECAYKTMLERHKSCLPPDHLFI